MFSIYTCIYINIYIYIYTKYTRQHPLCDINIYIYIYIFIYITESFAVFFPDRESSHDWNAVAGGCKYQAYSFHKRQKNKFCEDRIMGLCGKM